MEHGIVYHAGTWQRPEQDGMLGEAVLKCIVALSRAQAREVRQGFVRKVLGLVLLQLLVTAGASFAFLYVDPLKARSPDVYILLCMH